MLSRLLDAGELRLVLSELEELHERTVRKAGPAAARRRLRREWLLALWHFSGPRRIFARSPATAPSRKGSVCTDLLADTRDAARSLRRSPSFAVLVTLTLGIGVGSAGAVFAMANQLLLRPLPGIADPRGAAFLEFNSPERRTFLLSGPEVEALRGSATLLDGLATYRPFRHHASVAGSRPIEVDGVTVYGDYFEVLGVRPLAGRLLAAGEAGPDVDPFVAVIGERLWDRMFGRSPDVVGRQLEVGGQTLTVVGVAGGGFAGTERATAELWVPRSVFWPPESTLNQRFVARPQPGVALAAAEAQLNALLAGLAEAHVDGERGALLREVRAALYRGPLPSWTRDRARQTLLVLGGATGLLLLITCANVANLLLVRSVHRRGDAAVRLALGASAGRMARRYLLEALLLGTMGTLAGLGVAWLVSLPFRGMSLRGHPGFEGFAVDLRVLAFASAAVVVTAFLSGVLPAALASRFRLAEALRDAGTQASGRHGVIRHGTAALQIALSLTLLVGGLLLTRTVRGLYEDAGLALDAVWVLSVAMGERTQGAEHRWLLDAVRAVPGVEAPALHSGHGPYTGRQLARVAPAGASDADADAEAGISWVSPAWFDLFGVGAVRGRTFQELDWTPSPPRRAVVTAPLAARLFGRIDVVGQTVSLGYQGRVEEAEIVGVVGELRTGSLQAAPDEAVFLPYTTEPAAATWLTILFRASGSGAGAGPRLAEAVRSAVEAAAPTTTPVPLPAPLTDRIEAQLEEHRIFSRLLGMLSVLAVLVAAVGLYGVVAFAAAGRRREFAVRLALGADAHHIAKLVFGSAAAIVALGTALGLAGAYALSRVLESRLFAVAAMDLPSYAGAAGLLAAVAAVACWLPARAAAAADPASTLRRE